MTNNTQFTHPLDHILRVHVYGEITVQRFVTTTCDGTCRDWQPLPERAFNPFYEEREDHYVQRVSFLRELEELSEICQGHMECVETVKGMLRSYSFTAPARDHSTYGTLSLTILPWDDKERRLSCSRVIRSRVFDYDFRDSHFSLTTDYASGAMVVDLKGWRLAE